MDEVTEGRRLHNEELHDFTHQILFNNNEIDRACGKYGERKGAYKNAMRNTEGRRPLGRIKLLSIYKN